MAENNLCSIQRPGSPHISHSTLFGSAWLKEEVEAVASTVEAKWLMGSEEAAEVGAALSFLLFISRCNFKDSSTHRTLERSLALYKIINCE